MSNQKFDILKTEKLATHFWGNTREVFATIQEAVKAGLPMPKAALSELGESTGILLSKREQQLCISVFNKELKIEAINVDVGIPGMCTGEICNRESAVSLIAALIRGDECVSCVVSGSVPYIDELSR